MKIGLVLDDSLDRDDGVQQYVKTIGAWLADKNHQVEFLAGQSTPGINVHTLASNIAVRYNGNRLTVPLPASGRSISKLLRDEQFDVLHIQMPYSPMLAGKIIMRAQEHTAVVGTFHILPYGITQNIGNFLLGRVQKRSLNRYDFICAVSEAAMEFAKKNYGLSTAVIANTIELSKFANKVKPTPGRIVFLGRLVPRKGCKELLLAMASLPGAERKNCEIIVGGDGPERPALQKLAKNLSLNVKFTGYVPEKDKASLLGSADIAVFPSLGGESFGIVLLEAMAAGAGLVVGGDNPGYRGVLRETPDCLIDFRDPNTASQKLSRLIQDRRANKKLRLVQRQAVKKYDIETVGPQILDMYRTARLHRKQYVR